MPTDKLMPTDSEMLDWLEREMRPGVRIVGQRGKRVVAGGYADGVRIREAISVAMHTDRQTREDKR